MKSYIFIIGLRSQQFAHLLMDLPVTPLALAPAVSGPTGRALHGSLQAAAAVPAHAQPMAHLHLLGLLLLGLLLPLAALHLSAHGGGQGELRRALQLLLQGGTGLHVQHGLRLGAKNQLLAAEHAIATTRFFF